MRALYTIAFLLALTCSYGQFDPNYRKNERYEGESSPFNVGLGLGLNYGGIGGRLEGLPQKNVAIFGAFGFNLHKLGFNLGAKIRALPDKKVCPMFQFMYGYNAVIVVQGASELSQTYYGPSIGGGIELKMSGDRGFMEFGILIPFRPQEFSDDIDALQNIGLQITEPPPFAISIGYHFKF